MDGLVDGGLPVSRGSASVKHVSDQVLSEAPSLPESSELARPPGSLSWACPFSPQLP